MTLRRFGCALLAALVMKEIARWAPKAAVVLDKQLRKVPTDFASSLLNRPQHPADPAHKRWILRLAFMK